MTRLLPFNSGEVHVVNGDQVKLTINGRLMIWDITEDGVIAGCTEDGRLIQVQYSMVESAIRQPENQDARIPSYPT